MFKNLGFQSNKATLDSPFISQTSIIYGPSRIGGRSIIDSFVIIGYPTRAKTQRLFTEDTEQLSFEQKLDQVSTGSILRKKNHIRPFTTIYESSSLEEGVETGTNVIIRENCQIGKGSIIGSSTVLDGDVRIGKNARIQSQNFIPPRIRIGDDVFLGPAVRFSNDTYPVSKKLISTNVENNVVIGIGAIIISGITIGEGAVIAAGSIVTKNVSSNSVVMGAPARHKMTREEYNSKQKIYENS
ncbi:MAG: DapH/DapD/GlmU-related protein [Candidatus Hodarchaeales archaeon]|jgi:acetyltransferase-like isoleucine patch superfamily enzyme